MQIQDGCLPSSDGSVGRFWLQRFVETRSSRRRLETGEEEKNHGFLFLSNHSFCSTTTTSQGGNEVITQQEVQTKLFCFLLTFKPSVFS